MKLREASFPLKWELTRHKSSLPKLSTLSCRERANIAQSLSYKQVFEADIPLLNPAEQRKLRWKFLRNFYLATRQIPFDKCSFENALFNQPSLPITVEHFVAAVQSEYKFPNDMKMDSVLRLLFFSFAIDRKNSVDWREILVCYKILLYFRFIRDKSIDLVMILFEIYAEGFGASGRIVSKDGFVIKDARQSLRAVFTAPCINDIDIAAMDDRLEELYKSAIKRGDTIIWRNLLTMINEGSPGLLEQWRILSWDRLPPELRLVALDESQLYHFKNADAIVGRYQLTQALIIADHNCLKHVFRAWKMFTITTTGARVYNIVKIKR